MSLVFAGVCSHAGITGRAHMADPDVRDRFYDAFRQMGDDLRAEKPDAVVIIAAEHFANFFMNNMPSFAIGMADSYEAQSKTQVGSALNDVRCPAIVISHNGS